MNNRKNKQIDISVIIPVYNVEEYLEICVDSLLKQRGIHFEIILIDDGSTDRSGVIADQYAQKDDRVKVIHQKNGEASAARNAGLDVAQGEYIAFVDSDDWLKEDSLCKLYQDAIRFQADVVMGKVEFGHTDGSMNYYKPVPKEMMYSPATGKEAFIRLMKTGSYRPMVWNYIYRRSFLEEIQARFVIGITPHEDELWTPVVMCQAPKMVMVDTEYYYYRQREESVLYSTNLKKRLNAYIRVTNLLFEFTGRYDFSGKDAELKNWMYVNIFDRLQFALSFLSRIKDSSYILPAHQLDRFWRECCEMMPEPQKICNNHFRNAEMWLKVHVGWRISEGVASIKYQWMSGKKMMLLYNLKPAFDLSLKIADVPNDWVITTDRRFLQQADVVVFYLPTLQQELESDLNKLEKQIWVGWNMEAKINYQSKFGELFDIWMSYGKDSNLIYPFYKYEYLDIFTQKFLINPKQNKTLIVLPSLISEKKYLNYLEKLMKHIEFDKYFDNQIQLGKRETYSKYKFVIAFENAIETDYVTEKFYDPLLAGTVPIYLGAPNIEDFAPGDNCFVDVRKFKTAKALANFIKACYEDEQLYAKFLEWRNQPLRQSFLQKLEEQKEHPIVRLCRKVDEMKNTIQ